MNTVVLIKKDASIVTKKIKQFTFENVHKYMSFKDNKDINHHVWKLGKKHIHIFCKTTGRSNNINKFELPPPIDTPLFYGSLCVVLSSNKKQVDDDIIDVTADDWVKYYTKLMGGFEDLGEEDSYESDELDNYPAERITKEGYLKDGFIIDSDENAILDEEGDGYDENDDDEDDDEEEEYDEEDEYSGEEEYEGDGEYDSNSDGDSVDENEYYDSDESDVMSELMEEEYTSEDEN